MRVGFLSSFDSGNPDAMSGMPYSMRSALGALGCEVLPFFPEENRQRWHQRARVRMASVMPVPLKQQLKRLLGFTPRPTRRFASEEELYRHTRGQAIRQSREILAQVQPHDLDVLFGCCISTILCQLDVATPIVYFSDTTARLIFESYPRLRAQPEAFRRACEEIEREALSRTTAAVFATELARQSAIRDYGVPSERAFTVPMGANVSTEGIVPDFEPPSRESLRLVMTAADPFRKRLDLALDVIDALRGGGWQAHLVLIGPPTARALAHPSVECLGRLSLGTPAGRLRNREALRRSHLMILPSSAEAFGIAPCEAALLGRPSVVSSAGGLPEVVRHGETGLVLGLEATADDYAQAILSLAQDPARYRAMSAKALEHARRNYTWAHWADRLHAIMTRSVARSVPAP